MKKKTLLTAIASLLTLTAGAQLQGDGYYRVYNLGLDVLQKKRCYAFVSADKAIISTSAGTGQNFTALEFWPTTTQSQVGAPASIIYATLNGNYVDLEAQGTSVSKMTNYQLTLKQNGTANSYTLSTEAYATTLYLYATETLHGKRYFATTIANKSVAYKFWALEPLSSSSDDKYFGVAPTLEANGKYYAPFYASFPFKFASTGMKAYYVDAADSEHYSLKEITADVKPAATPMIIECSSNEPTNNRLDLVRGGYTPITDNKLSGVYFCNDYFDDDTGIRTHFDAATMRVWNVEDGKLVLSTATDNLHSSYYAGKANFPDEKYHGYINANESYLTVSSTANSTLTLGATGIKDLTSSVTDVKPVSYTTLSGMRIDAPQAGAGVVIVKYSDGTARRVVY